MKRWLGISGLLFLIAGAAISYLIATGERGLSRQMPPGRTLDVFRLPLDEAANLGWKAQGLDQVFAHAAALSTDSLMIVTDGRIVGSFGDLSRLYNVHSIRKSLLGTLIGQQLGSEANRLQLDATLLELGIDDAPVPLSALQRQATVLHLFKSTSGINHPAAASGGLQAEIDKRLGREDNEPGTIWAYNNWDYNALTTIFETETATPIADAFDVEIAQPAGLQDFKRSDVSYIFDAGRSEHRAAMFRLSARDLARIGQIFIDDGRANCRKVLPEDWASRITEESSETGIEGLRWRHGYLWWIPGPDTGLPDGTFWAWGLGNQALVVIPEWKTVIVHQSDTTEFLKRYQPLIQNQGMTGEAALMQLLLSCRDQEARDTEYCTEHRFISRREFDRLVSLIVAARK